MRATTASLGQELHGWLGGYPYESMTPRKLKTILHEDGFILRNQVIKSEGVHITSGYDEFLFQRV